MTKGKLNSSIFNKYILPISIIILVFIGVYLYNRYFKKKEEDPVGTVNLNRCSLDNQGITDMGAKVVGFLKWGYSDNWFKTRPNHEVRTMAFDEASKLYGLTPKELVVCWNSIPSKNLPASNQLDLDYPKRIKFPHTYGT